MFAVIFAVELWSNLKKPSENIRIKKIKNAGRNV